MPTKSNLYSNPNRKVRIVAKIRGFTPQESQSSKPWISISKNNQSDRVVVSFTGDSLTCRLKDVYEVDHCYEQNEGVDLIFSREIKPLIPDILNGKKATFIGFGARGSGKTYAIQGSDENPGLATLTVTEILSRVAEAGKFVTVSIYEAFQEHVYDILDPSRPEVQVLETSQGKINLKGLSEVSVKSVTEFQKLYHGECSTKTTQKTALEQPRRSHKGLMIRILSCDKTSNMKLVGKINFVDLAGYEDCRTKGKNTGECISFNNVESSKINRSLHAFLNVVHALNANENRVPYRESKLTRVLQDSLGGTNHVLILTCMNPLVCQETAYAMSLASRACLGINHVLTDSTNRSKSSSKPTVVSSMKKVKPAFFSATTRKQTSLRVNLSQKKANLKVEGRKLFVDKTESITSEQEKTVSEVSLDKTSEEETLSTSVFEKRELTTMVEEDQPREENIIEDALSISNDIKALTHFEGGLQSDSVQEDPNNGVVGDCESPPLSVRLKELSNEMKSLCSSAPLYVNKPLEVGTQYSGQLVTYVDCVEPKTPTAERDNDNRAITNFASPLVAFSARSTGMKQSLVEGYLQFLNSANKEELKGLWGIGEKRATYILERREESPEPFKSLDDLKDIGMSGKQIKTMMKSVAGGIFK